MNAENAISILFLAFTLFVLCSLATRIYHKHANIVSILVAPWCIFCGLMVVGVYGAYHIQITTVMIVCFSCFAYSLPCFAFSKHRANTGITFITPYAIKQKTLILTNVLAIIVCILISRRMWNIIFSQGFTRARYYFLNASTDNTVYTTFQIYILYVCFAIFTATILIAIHSILSKSYNWIAITFSVIDLVLYVFAIAGRMTIFRMLFYLGIGFLLKKGRMKIGKREKIIIICFVAILVYITSMRRMVNSRSIFQDIIFYFAGPFGYLNYIVENPIQFVTKPTRLYGRITFGFISQPIEMILYLAGFKSITFSDVTISKVTGAYYEVAPGISQNHSSTAAFYFYKDFGIWGLIIGFFVLAYIGSYIYNKCNFSKKNQIFWQCMMLYISYVLFFTIWEYQLMSWSVVVIVALLYLVTADRPFVRIKIHK